MEKTLLAAVGEKNCDEERVLTVRKTSVFYPGDGYDAYDHHTGNLVFRVDTYGHGSSLADHLVLMDAAGAPILTVHRKRTSLHQRWEGFLGEREEGQKPLFSVSRSSMFGRDCDSIEVETHDGGDGGNDRQYRIEGCFAQRICRVLMCSCSDKDDEHEEVVAEVKRKEGATACAHVDLGKDVFSLSIKPHLDAAFAMGLVLVLDQICGDDDNHYTISIDAAAPIVPDDDDDLK